MPVVDMITVNEVQDPRLDSEQLQEAKDFFIAMGWCDPGAWNRAVNHILNRERDARLWAAIMDEGSR